MLGKARVLSAELACAMWRLCERIAGEPPWDDVTRRYREPLPPLWRALYVPCHRLHAVITMRRTARESGR